MKRKTCNFAEVNASFGKWQSLRKSKIVLSNDGSVLVDADKAKLTRSLAFNRHRTKSIAAGGRSSMLEVAVELT